MSKDAIRTRIPSDMAVAMKARAADTLGVLKAALLEAKIRKPRDAVLPLGEQDRVLRRCVKKRRETIEEVTRTPKPSKADDPDIATFHREWS